MYNLNEKYQEIIRTAKELFWKFGIKKVTVEEICEQAGTSRVTFYKYFSNKEELAFYIIKELSDNTLTEYREIMDSDDSFENKVRRTIHLKITSADHISHELLNDIYSGEYPRINDILKRISMETFSMIENDYRKAQVEGNIRKDVKIEFIMYILRKIQEMAADQELEKLYSDSGKVISEMVNFFFYGLLPRKEEQQ